MASIRKNKTLLAALFAFAFMPMASIAQTSLQGVFTDIVKEQKEEQTGNVLPEGAASEGVAVQAESGNVVAQPQEEAVAEAAPVVSAEAARENAIADLSVLQETIGTEGFTPSYGAENFSLMFPGQSMEDLRRLLDIYEGRAYAERNNPAFVTRYDDIIEALFAVPEDESNTPLLADAAPTPLPSYYLGTILYRSPSNWTIWINGKRFSNGDEIDGLTIRSVSAQQVAFAWKPDSLAPILAPWEERKAGVRKYAHRSATRQTVAVNFDEAIVSFSLRRNQTFNAQAMEVYEGKFVEGIDPFTYVPPPSEVSASSQGTSLVNAESRAASGDLAQQFLNDSLARQGAADAGN